MNRFISRTLTVSSHRTGGAEEKEEELLFSFRVTSITGAMIAAATITTLRTVTVAINQAFLYAGLDESS